MLVLNRNLLANLLAISESEYGFTGSVVKKPEGLPYLMVHALSDISWDEESRQLFEKARKKGLEFHNLDNLFGAAVTGGKPVISNDPASDQRSRGTPNGHPTINNFLCIPVYYPEEIIGLIGLANRYEGYDKAIIDYLDPLVAAFGQVLQARKDQNARRAAEKILARQARLDGLLGIPNRRYFDEQLHKQLIHSSRNRAPFSIIMIDVDHFKLYNDFYGHQQGDKCLIAVSKAIQEGLRRPMDFLARYGGEEFCCILPDTGRQGAMKVAANIRASLARVAIPHENSPVSESVTISMGVATWLPENKTSAEKLLRQADMNLYSAKRNGRDRAVADFSGSD